MADWEELLLDGMIVDCSTISISYSPNGLAQISFTVYTLKEDGVPYDEGGPGFNLCLGGVTFFGWVNQQSLVPDSEIELLQWDVSATAIGCKKGPCNEGCQ